MSLDYLISILTRHERRFALGGEALEDRCQLSACPVADVTMHTVEDYDGCVVSQIVEVGTGRLPRSPLVTEVVVDAAGARLTPGTLDTGSAVGSIAIQDEVLTQPLIAVQPDDDVDPFVDCPGLDERFCLPTDIDFGFDDDLLDGLTFDTQAHFTDIFDAGYQASEHDFLLPGDRQFRWQ